MLMMMGSVTVQAMRYMPLLDDAHGALAEQNGAGPRTGTYQPPEIHSTQPDDGAAEIIPLVPCDDSDVLSRLKTLAVAFKPQPDDGLVYQRLPDGEWAAAPQADQDLSGQPDEDTEVSEEQKDVSPPTMEMINFWKLPEPVQAAVWSYFGTRLSLDTQRLQGTIRWGGRLQKFLSQTNVRHLLTKYSDLFN